MKCKRMVLPLLGTAFEPGRLADTLNEFEDEELAEIAQAEAYFFQHRQKPVCKLQKSVLIHIPPEKELPLLSDYLRYLPEGQRLFAMNLLTPVEFSIAMLACRDWTNKCQFSENRR